MFLMARAFTSSTVPDNVEIHLSNGVELGLTKPSDIAAGASTETSLAADGNDFETRSAHL